MAMQHCARARRGVRDRAVKELRRNEWVTIGLAARRLNTSQAVIRQWLHRNKTIARKGRLVLFLHVEETEARMRDVAS